MLSPFWIGSLFFFLLLFFFVPSDAHALRLGEQVKDNRPPNVVGCLLPFMPQNERYQNRIELLQGTLDMLILRTLQWGPQHGHGIGFAIRSASDELLQIEHGSLYPALHRLERQGWVASEWKMTENKQRAKYYRLTAAGKKQLAAERSRWGQLVGAIARIMDPA
jgi:transcriptional regulator